MHGHKNETPAEVYWIAESTALSTSKMNETIGWNAIEWSPLFSITKESCVPFTLDHFSFGGLIHDQSIKFWSSSLEKKLIQKYKVDASISEKSLQNCTNEVFQEKSVSAHNINMIQSDRLSKEYESKEEQVSHIVKPIKYELLRDGSVDFTPKNESPE